MRTIYVMLLAVAFTAAASAQDAAVAPNDGTWAMTGTNGEGQAVDAELVLKGDSGTWRLFAGRGRYKKDNPCFMKYFPVSVQKSTADELTFHVDGTKVIAGCNEFTATLKRTDSNSFDGTTDGNSKLHIEHK
jgi:hypothetical protein